MSKVEDLEPHILDKYNIIQRLGKGAYGVVWRAINKETKSEVAIKKVFDAFHNSTDAQRTFREVVFLKELYGHENVVKLHTLIRAENPNDLYLVFEFVEIDLHHVIRGNILEEVHKQSIIYQILKSLKYIHSANIIHRDLKPSNILLSADCHVKVADFGLARSVSGDDDETSSQILTEYIATRWYRAPEIVLGSQRYSKAIDVWSVGCIMAEMITGKAPFPGKSTLNQIELIIELLGRPSKEDIESLDSELAFKIMDNIKILKQKPFALTFAKASPEALDLLKKLLHFNPKTRITVEEALNHPYLQAFHFPEEETVFEKKRITIPINDNIKLSRHDYRKALHRLIDEAEAEDKKKEDAKNHRRSISRGSLQKENQPLSEGPSKYASQPAPPKTTSMEGTSKFGSGHSVVHPPAPTKVFRERERDSRPSSKSKERPASSQYFSDNLYSGYDLHAKKPTYQKEEPSHELNMYRKNSRDSNKPLVPENPFEKPTSHKELHSTGGVNYFNDPKAYKFDPRGMPPTGGNSKKLLANSSLMNQSQSNQGLLNNNSLLHRENSQSRNIDENKENKSRLANKENYYSKYLRQATEGSAAHSRDVTNNDSFHSKSVQNPNSSVEGIKAGYSKYDYKSNGKTGNSFSSAGGSDSLSKAPTYNLIGSRILKKLKSGVGPTVTPDQILKAGVVENKYLYNAILNSQKSRPKLANPFKADN